MSPPGAGAAGRAAKAAAAAAAAEEKSGPPAKRLRRAGGEAPRQPEAQGRRIVLIGMRAAGKTTLGRVAAERLGKQFVDLDEILEKEVFGCKINDFVDREGWAKFRAAEAQLLADVVLRGCHVSDEASGCVVATGGGVIETPSVQEVLEQHSPVIWIDRHIDDICRCLEGVGSYRPSLGSSPREIYERRRPLYDKLSDFVFTMRLGDENWPVLERRFAHLASWAAADAAGKRLPAANPVCVPIVASTVGEACVDIAEAACQGAGLVELRVDKLAGGPEAVTAALPELIGSARAVGLPTCTTFRPTWEDPNAGYSGEEKPRLQALRRAAALGSAFIDVERGAAEAFAAEGGLPEGSPTRLVVSSHDFKRLWSLDELRRLVSEMRALAGPAGVVKVAQMAGDTATAARMLTVLQESGGKSTVALAMGEAGVFTRLLSPRLGATFTFGCLSGRSSAPGQPTAVEMLEVYRLGSMSASTEVFALLGDPVAASPLPAVLNAGLAAAGSDAVYVPLLVRGCSLAELLNALPSGLLSAASVEPALERAAFEAAPRRDALAARRGAAAALRLPAAGPPEAMGAEECGGDGVEGLVSKALAHFELLCGQAPASEAAAAMRRAAEVALGGGGTP